MRAKRTVTAPAQTNAQTAKTKTGGRRRTEAPSIRSTGGKSTIAQVAVEAGVSVATVSRVVSGSECYMSADTRLRVEQAIERLQYTPNRLIRSLQRGRSDVIAYIGLAGGLGTKADEFVSASMHEMFRAAAAKSYDVLIPVGSLVDNGLPRPATLMDGRCDGFIIAAPDTDPLINILAGRGFPIVEMWNRHVPQGVGCVLQDVAGGVRKAIDHLVGLGHRRIAHFVGPIRTFDTARWRMEEHLSSLANAGIEPDAQLLMPQYGSASWAVDTDELSTSLDYWFGLPTPPTAVFCASDRMAIALIKMATARGIRVPEDLSVVGFDDISLASYSTPPLTTVSIPVDRAATQAIDILVRLIGARDGEASEPVGNDALVAVIEAELVVRESTAPPRRG